MVQIVELKLILRTDHSMKASGVAMRAWLAGFVATGLLAVMAIVTQTPASSQPTVPTASPAQAGSGGTRGNVTQVRVLSASDRKDNWMVYGGNFEIPQHFSPLNTIDDQNISTWD